jgi:hypothetical protein
VNSVALPEKIGGDFHKDFKENHQKFLIRHGFVD